MDNHLTMKACRACNQFKLSADFGPAKANKDGLDSYCRPCRNAKTNARRANPTPAMVEAKKGYDRKHYGGNRTEIRRKQKGSCLKHRYGITEADYEAMFVFQGGRCPICNEGGKELVVDHDHETGVVRGLLCRGCNLSLGLLERAGWLTRALAYLGRAS